MAQFQCETCGESFEQQSRLNRHRETAHPKRALSAADIVQELKGIKFPKTKAELVAYIEDKGKSEEKEILENIPQRTYRDTAEVTRAIGEIKSLESKPSYQPSRKGGQAAMQSLSASQVASQFKGFRFPANVEEVRKFAQEKAKPNVARLTKNFRAKNYENMADIEKEFGAVLNKLEPQSRSAMK